MLTHADMSFFGQALNNTSERSEASLANVVLRPFTFCYWL